MRLRRSAIVDFERWRFALLLCLFVQLSACTSFASTPFAADENPAGPNAVFLVANPRISHPIYRRSVLIVVAIDADRHVGLILNRPTNVTLGSLYPDHEPSKKVNGSVFFGGTSLRNRLAAVARSTTNPGPGAFALIGDVFMVTRAKAIDRIIETAPNDARYFIGHVSWKPGELRHELSHRFWYVLPADAATIMRGESRSLWRTLMQRVRTMQALGLDVGEWLADRGGSARIAYRTPGRDSPGAVEGRDGLPRVQRHRGPIHGE